MKTKSHDVRAKSNPPLPAASGYGPAPKQAQVEPPTAVTDPPSPTQPTYKAPPPPVSEAAKDLPDKLTAAPGQAGESARHGYGGLTQGASEMSARTRSVRSRAATAVGNVNLLREADMHGVQLACGFA